MEAYAVTLLLDAARRGDEGAAERLWQVVHQELRAMAADQMAREHGPRTLQPTALVNEVYLKLFGGERRSDKATEPRSEASAGSQAPQIPNFENRRHFFAAAARAMHQILVDDARTRGRLKRGGSGRSGSGRPPSRPEERPAGTPDAAVDRSTRPADVRDERPTRRSDATGGRVPVDDLLADAPDPAEVLAVDEALAKLGAEQPELVEIVRLRYFVGLTLDETADVLGISRRTVATRWRLAKAWLYEALKQ
jgi:RNA polymerase sigma factor (sigma-70 family)